MTTEDPFHQLAGYTLEHPGEDFIHQYIVDAYGAQTASPSDKPIRLVFALVGLYLHTELGLNGREVQRMHARLAQRKSQLPQISIPESRGAVTVADVLEAPPGPERDRKIEDWCLSVWKAYRQNRAAIVRVARAVAHAHHRDDAEVSAQVCFAEGRADEITEPDSPQVSIEQLQLRFLTD